MMVSHLDWQALKVRMFPEIYWCCFRRERRRESSIFISKSHASLCIQLILTKCRKCSTIHRRFQKISWPIIDLTVLRCWMRRWPIFCMKYDPVFVSDSATTEALRSSSKWMFIAAHLCPLITLSPTLMTALDTMTSQKALSPWHPICAYWAKLHKNKTQTQLCRVIVDWQEPKNTLPL